MSSPADWSADGPGPGAPGDDAGRDDAGRDNTGEETSSDVSIWDWEPPEDSFDLDDPGFSADDDGFAPGFRDLGEEHAQSVYPPPDPAPAPAPMQVGTAQGGTGQGSAGQAGTAQGGAERGGAERGGAERGGAERGGAERGGAERGGAGQGGRGAAVSSVPPGGRGAGGHAKQWPGIGQRRGNLAHLSADPRRRAWQIRTIIVVIVAVVFAIVVSWRLGLTLAVVAAIADTVYRSKTRYHSRPGVKLTGAQRHTRRQLNKLRRAGYQAMHSNPIPDSAEQIDHLVVGPAGVFAIDSEAWDKRLVVRTKNARQLYHGPFSKKDRLEHARWEAARASEMLSSATGTQVTVRPAMAVYGPRLPWDIATIREVDVFSGPRLRRYLRRRMRQAGVRPLSEKDIERIYAAADLSFPHYTPGAHIR